MAEPVTPRSPLEVHASLLKLAEAARAQVATNQKVEDYLLPDSTPAAPASNGGSSK